MAIWRPRTSPALPNDTMLPLNGAILLPATQVFAWALRLAWTNHFAYGYFHSKIGVNGHEWLESQVEGRFRNVVPFSGDGKEPYWQYRVGGDIAVDIDGRSALHLAAAKSNFEFFVDLVRYKG